MFELISGDGQKQGLDQQERNCKFTCKLLSCICSFFHWVATNKRCKSQLLSQLHRNKICERCSCVGHLSSANLVTNVPTVAIDPPVGARLHQFWEKWEALGSSPKVVTVLREGYTLPFRFRPNLTRSHQLCQPAKTLPPFGGTVSAGEQECSRAGSKPKIPGVLQPAIFSTQTQQPVETYLGPEHLKHFPKHGVVQNEDTRDYKNLPTDRGVGYLHRYQECILPHNNSKSVQEVHAFLRPGSVLLVQPLPFGLSTAPMEFTVVAKEVKLIALQRGIRIHQYLDYWLLRATPHQTCLQHTHTLVALCRELGWLENKEKSELDPKQVFNFVGYQFDLKEGKVRPTPDCWQALTDKIQTILSGVSGPPVHVPHRASDSHRKASTVALKEQLEDTRITRKGDTSPQVAPPPPKVVAGGKQCATSSTITPSKTCSTDIYRCIKRRVGHSLKRAHCKGNQVPSRKQVAYKPLGTKGGLPGLKRVQRPCFEQHSSGGHRQHNSGCLYKQRGGG